MSDIDIRIAQHPFAKPLSEAALKVISKNAREEVFASGQVIFRAGEPANCVYLIEDGKVAVEAHEPNVPDRLVQTIGAETILGWSWLFAPFAWHLQARALERTRAIRVDGAHVLVQCEADPKIGYEIMKRVSQIIIERLHSLAIQKRS
jgi:CRP/FNR family transcriptional regulator, cyclic AMP receptor protein